MRSGTHDRRARRTAPLLATGAIAIAACTGSSDDSAVSVPSTISDAPVPRVDDGVLRIGALIPVNDTAVGANLVEAVEQAVAEVNAAGGVLGNRVDLQIEDEGTTATTAAEATATLVADGSDAIVGPTSSNVAVAALDVAVGAGILTCSATATAISLNDYPDDQLFFRSIATDSLQAVAIADYAASRGARSAVIVHVDDAYGEPYAAAVEEALNAGPSIQVTSVAVPSGADDLRNEIDTIATAGADTAIVLGDGDDIARILEAISTRNDIDFTQIIVNDAARAASSTPVIAGLPPTFQAKIVGLLPQILLPETPDDKPFASQITDCVNLIALATAQGDSDAPDIIKGQMASVSSGGDRCRDFAECVEKLDADEQIDYNGPTGITNLARDGDPSRAFFERFTFNADGSAESTSSVAIDA